ncbi:unnamed protein product, partial [Prorocentrum cordatum]
MPMVRSHAPSAAQGWSTGKSKAKGSSLKSALAARQKKPTGDAAKAKVGPGELAEEPPPTPPALAAELPSRTQHLLPGDPGPPGGGARPPQVEELNQAVAELEIKLGDKKSALVQANTELQNIRSEVHLARTAVLAATAQPVGSDIPSVQEAMGRLQTVFLKKAPLELSLMHLRSFMFEGTSGYRQKNGANVLSDSAFVERIDGHLIVAPLGSHRVAANGTYTFLDYWLASDALAAEMSEVVYYITCFFAQPSMYHVTFLRTLCVTLLGLVPSAMLHARCTWKGQNAMPPAYLFRCCREPIGARLLEPRWRTTLERIVQFAAADMDLLSFGADPNVARTRVAQGKAAHKAEPIRVGSQARRDGGPEARREQGAEREDGGCGERGDEDGLRLAAPAGQPGAAAPARHLGAAAGLRAGAGAPAAAAAASAFSGATPPPRSIRLLPSLLLSARATVSVCAAVARRAKAPVSEYGAPSGVRNFQEMTLGFTSDIARNNLGESFYRPWVPFVTTIFLFIFGSNWSGALVPWKLLELPEGELAARASGGACPEG